MVNAIVVSQPKESVTVNVPGPSQRPVAFKLPCPPRGSGAHRYVYGGAPPDTTPVAVPSHTFAQLIGVVCTVAMIGTAGRMVKFCTSSHPWASVTVTLHAPAQSWEAVGLPCPCGGAGDHT